MTQAVTTTKVTFTLPMANGAAVPWRYLAAGHHRGYFLDADGDIIRDLVAGTDFIVTPEGDTAANAGGVALLDVAPNDAVQFRLERMTPATQGYVSTPGAEGVETQMDRGTMAVQEALRDLGGTLRVYGMDQRPVALANGEVPMMQNGRLARGPTANKIENAQGYAIRAEDAANALETQAAPFLALHTLVSFNTNLGGAAENANRWYQGCLDAASSKLPLNIYGGGTIPMGAKMRLPPGGNLHIMANPSKIFMPVFTDSLGFFGPEDRSVIVPNIRVEGLTIAPAVDISTGRVYAGNGVIGMFSGSVFNGVCLKQYSGDQGFLVAGYDTVFEDCYGYCDDPFTANGLFRLFGGRNCTIINLRGTSGDDCFMAVPIEAASSPFFNRSIRDCYYIGGDVTSNHARGLAVITAAGVTAAVENMHFWNFIAKGGFEQMVIRGLNGLVKGVTVNGRFNAQDDQLTFERRSAVLVQGNVADSTFNGDIHNVQGQVLRVSKYDLRDQNGTIVQTFVPKSVDVTLRSHDTPAQNFITRDANGPISPVTYPTVDISDGINNRLDLDIQCHETDDGIVVSGGLHLSLRSRVYQVPNGKTGVRVTGGFDTQLIFPESFAEGSGTGTAYEIGAGLQNEVTVHGGRHNGGRLDQADLAAVSTLAEFDTAIAGRVYPKGTIARAGELQFIYDGGTNIPARPGWAPFGPIVTPEHFGAAMNGVANDAAALQAAVNYNGRVVLPAGKTIRVASTITIPAGLTTFAITGGRGSKILWAGDALPVNFLNFDTNYAAVNIPNVELRDFAIVGSHAANLSWIASYPLYVRNADRAIFNNVQVSYSRVMGIVARQCTYVSVTNCEVHHCARDGINLEDCVETIIADNFVHDTDDDSIAVHNSIYSWQRGHTITGNKVTRAQGIRCQGVNVATISNNTLQFFILQGINVETVAYNAALFSGMNPAIAISITGNVLSDGIDRQFLDNLNQTCRYIRVTGDSAQAGSLTYVPGWQGTSPYSYYDNIHVAGDLAATTPIPESSGIVIANNVMKRTLPRSGMFSTLGFDRFWLRGGSYDYDLSSAADISCIVLAGYLRDLTISGNSASGENTFLTVGTSGGLVRPIRNCRVQGNIVSDIKNYAVSIVTTTQTLDIIFDGNTFDMDPYHIHANRGTTGGWLADGLPQILIRQGALGLSWFGNDIKNACRFETATLASMVNSNLIAFERNRFWGTPAEIGRAHV